MNHEGGEWPGLLAGDAFDDALVSEVHPQGWKNPEPAERYDLVVLGGGTAGLVAAVGGAGLGARVALVERALLGGDCLNLGCVPSKALIASGRAVADVRRAQELGVVLDGEARVDFPAVMERMRRLRAGIAPHDGAARLEGLGIDVFLGEGRFSGADSLEVGSARLRFKRAVIATGAAVVLPPIEGLRDIDPLTYETVWRLQECPRRLIVVGGGPIGCELAQAFRRFGSRVLLLQRNERLLPRETPRASEVLTEALRRDGIRVELGARVQRARLSEEGPAVWVTHDGTGEAFSGDAVLLATGRLPVTEGLGLEAAGIAFDRKRGVTVDSRLRTTNPRVFAAGDAATQQQFTHLADAMARLVLQNAFFFGRKRVEDLVVPQCTYTDPEVARVGMTPAEAEAAGRRVDVVSVGLDEVDRARIDDESEGFLEVTLERGGDRILGATLVSRHAGETIGQITQAMRHGIGLGALGELIQPYPVQAAVIKLAGDRQRRTKLTPRAARLLRTIIRLRR